MTISWHGNAFHIIGSFWRESTVRLRRSMDAERWCFRWSQSEQIVKQTVEMPVTHCKRLKIKSATHFSSEGGKPLNGQIFVLCYTRKSCLLLWMMLPGNRKRTWKRQCLHKILFDCLLRPTSKKISKHCITGHLCRRGIHWWPVDSLHKCTVRRRAFHVVNFLGVSLQTRSFQIRWVTMFHSNVNVTFNTLILKVPTDHKLALVLKMAFHRVGEQ